MAKENNRPRLFNRIVIVRVKFFNSSAKLRLFCQNRAHSWHFIPLSAHHADFWSSPAATPRCVCGALAVHACIHAVDRAGGQTLPWGCHALSRWVDAPPPRDSAYGQQMLKQFCHLKKHIKTACKLEKHTYFCDELRKWHAHCVDGKRSARRRSK